MKDRAELRYEGNERVREEKLLVPAEKKNYELLLAKKNAHSQPTRLANQIVECTNDQSACPRHSSVHWSIGESNQVPLWRALLLNCSCLVK